MTSELRLVAVELGSRRSQRLHHLRWAFDISIIIADLMYFSAFYVVLTVFQCVLGHSTRST